MTPITSLTGKRLSGVNARRRLQAQRRAALIAACLGPATFPYWQTAAIAPEARDTAFTCIQDRILAIRHACVPTV